jgi:hypothetical protein
MLTKSQTKQDPKWENLLLELKGNAARQKNWFRKQYLHRMNRFAKRIQLIERDAIEESKLVHK